MKLFESDEISFCTVLVLRSNSASVLYIKAVNKEQTSQEGYKKSRGKYTKILIWILTMFCIQGISCNCIYCRLKIYSQLLNNTANC